MKLALVPLACIAALIVTLISTPWMFAAIGCSFLGDDNGFDRWIDAAPLSRWFDYVDRRPT